MLQLDGLNDPQRQAVTTIEGPLLVLAGAGSGKTRVITYRVGYLLQNGVAPSQILAVSFTNKAAAEMRERVEKLVGPGQASKLTLSTFHALGLQILKAEKAAFGFKTGFTVYDQADQLGVVRECLREVKIDDRRFDAKAIHARISRAKNAFLTPEEFAARGSVRGGRSDEYDLVTAEIYPRYQSALHNFHAFDFDDLIVEPVRLFDRDEAIRTKWQNRFRYVMVDEYQDTNRTQLMMVRHLAAHRNLCVVGDDDQSIYAFRGAESDNILDFERHFEGARVVTLDQNYRSTQVILQAANAVIANNGKRHKKNLFTTNPGDNKIQLFRAEDAEAEAKFVVDEIELLRGREGFKLRDFAILYRSNLQSRFFEEALRMARIEYRMIGGQAFFERKEVKDGIAYLKSAIQPRDEIALRRVVNYPARGVGDTSLERCAAFAATQKITLGEALTRVREIPEMTPRAVEAISGFTALLERHRIALRGKTGLAVAARAMLEETAIRDDLVAAGPTAKAAQRRIENLNSFTTSLAAWEERQGGNGELGDYLHRLSLSSKDDDEGEETDRVTMVTLHGAKGLEFRAVFLVGLEEELIPHKRTINPIATDVDAGGDISEERRLLYVGITRARQRLYLSHCARRSSFEEGSRSGVKPRVPSRFLAEIPLELTESPPPPDPVDDAEVARQAMAKMRAMIAMPE